MRQLCAAAIAPIFALTFACLAYAAGDVEQEAAPLKARGTLKVEIELTASKALVDSTIVNLTIGAQAYDDSYSNSSFVSATATVEKGKATAKVTVPYSWVLLDGSGKLYVTIGASASAGGVSDMSTFSQDIPMPKDGAVKTVRVSGTI